VAFSPDGRRLAATTPRRRSCFGASTGRSCSWPAEFDRSDRRSCAGRSRSARPWGGNKIAAVSRRQNGNFWNSSDRELFTLRGNADSILSLHSLPMSTMASAGLMHRKAVGSNDVGTILWFHGLLRVATVTLTAFSSDGRRIISDNRSSETCRPVSFSSLTARNPTPLSSMRASLDGGHKLLRTAAGSVKSGAFERQGSFNVKGHTGEVHCLGFSPDASALPQRAMTGL